MNDRNQKPSYVLLGEKAAQAYEAKSLKQANAIMANLITNTLGNEAADALGLTKEGRERTKIKLAFFTAAKKVLDEFSASFNENGEYREGKEKEYKNACDQEGPIAKQKLLEILDMGDATKKGYEHTKNILNNIYVEDAARLAIRALKLEKVLNEEESKQIEQEVVRLCKDTKATRDMFAKVVPTDDHYYQRIYQEKKINDQSVLKFHKGESHNDDELNIIDLSLRLANATRLAAQRNAAKKDGKKDRIDPDKRQGVFNTPNYRNIKQFKKAIESGMSAFEAVMIVTFELCKDSRMVED